MMLEIREVTYLSIVLRIVAALILGGVLGLEREMKNRPAGLRTYMLVCVGACMIMLTNQYIWQTFGTGDPVRMGAQVVNGIGFLGAGTIVVTRRNQIKGLTTAAGLWTAAAMGLALGIGFYEAAVFGGLITFITLTVMLRGDDLMRRKTKMMELYVELDTKLTLGCFMEQVRAAGMLFESVQVEPSDGLPDGVRAYIIIVRSMERVDHAVVTDKIRGISGVLHLEEL